MITLNCDKCDKPFEIEEEAAGEKVQCPYCGDINRVPGKPSTAPLASNPATPSRSTIPPTAAAAPEHTLAIVRQAMFGSHPFWYSLMAAAFFGGLIFAAVAAVSPSFAATRWWVWVGVGFMAAGGLWWFGWWIAPHRWIKLTITTKRTIRQEGIVVRHTSEVLHEHIRNVKIDQSFMQRLLGVGSISIDSAGGSEAQPVEIQMNDVPRPYKVKELIDKHRRM